MRGGGGGGGGTGRSEGDKIGGTGGGAAARAKAARGLSGSTSPSRHRHPPRAAALNGRCLLLRPLPAPGPAPRRASLLRPPGARCPDVGPFRGRVPPAAATTAAAAAAAPPRRVPRRRGCSMEADGEAEARLLLQEARESIEAARSYRRELEQRLRGLHQARKQIRESATLTRDVLEQHFNDLKGTLKKLLDERLMSLLQEVDAIEQDSIKPLDECQKLIEHGVSTADDLLREGESAVHGDVGQQNEKLCSFTKKALHIQLDSLPEVPSLVDVPCLSAQLDDCLLTILKNQIFKHGTVASRPPVQLEEFIEKPGGILVRWCKVDDDFIPQDYRLQYRKSTASHFEDVYVGSETEFIVLHIDPNVDYQFRVCARGDGRQEWSPWSVPQIGRTTLVPHEWTAGLEGYSLSSRRNIALRNDSQSCGVLYSKAPTYFCGQTLTFRIETVGQPDRRDSLGVCVEQQNGYDSLQRDKAVCISTNGAVFVNGKEMTNQLPAVTSGSTVTFDMEVVQLGPSSNEGGNFKLRVTISSNNREVVFDWVLDQCCVSLYFGCSFSYPGWKVLVF